MMVAIPKSGERSRFILHSALNSDVFVERSPADRQTCVRLNVKGLLSRDKAKANTWYPTSKARKFHPVSEEAMAVALPAVVEEAPTDIIGPRSDVSGLAQTVERARALFNDGDVLAAHRLAGGGYLEAKAVAQYAATFGADGKRLIAKARQLQADALLIETRAKMRIAAAYDAAQAAGEAAKQGRPKNVPDENVFTLAEAGLSRKEIHDARKYLAGEQMSPGLVERAIAARISAGLEPSRASLRAAVGTHSATSEERGNNLYETPPEAMWTLLALEKFGSKILEPACGRGAITRMLEREGYTVLLSDLVDYGTADQFGELQRVEDFLESEASADNPDIVTNPPYGVLLNRFVAHALRVHKPRKMALLLNSIFLFGFDDPEREFSLDECKPSRVILMKRRLPMMHRDGWDGPEANSRMNTIWLIWERNEDGIYDGEMRISRVDWKDYAIADAESEAA
jgi:hypothetical protein